MTVSTGFGKGRGAMRSTRLMRDLALVAITNGPGRWAASGACRGIADPEVMFPTAVEGTVAYQRQVRQAQAVCAGCPVRTECLEYALTGEDTGVWGGLGPAERRELACERRGLPGDGELGEVA